MLGLWRIVADAHAPLRLASTNEGIDAEGAHRFAEIGRLVFADRDRYLADPGFAAIPGGTAALLDDDYLARRATLVGDRAMPGPASPGLVAGAAASSGRSFEHAATTHVSIVDSRGNAVAMTSSIESAFGARIMVRGFLLNNQLTDFSFAPTRDGAAVANRVQPGKRPRSAMAPTLVLDQASGDLELVIGSPGGPSIINYVARSLISILDDGVDAQPAVSMPNLGNRNGPTELERGRAPRALADALRARGHDIREVDMTSGLHAIALDCPPPPRHHRRCTLAGAVDPRREGSAIGVAPPHAASAANGRGASGRATAASARKRPWTDAR